jgi:hypothetical protein
MPFWSHAYANILSPSRYCLARSRAIEIANSRDILGDPVSVHELPGFAEKEHPHWITKYL